MDPISRLAQSLALLRRPASVRPAPPPGTGSSKAAPAPSSRARGSGSATGLRERIVSRLAALSDADLASQERQALVFVEQVLTQEWGTTFRESPQARQMVKRVARAMRNDPRIRAELEATLQELAAESRQRPARG